MIMLFVGSQFSFPHWYGPIFGTSPSFPRQGIQDGHLDFQNFTKIRDTITNKISYEPVTDFCKNGSNSLPSTDIKQTNFNSDGKVLNVTLETYPSTDYSPSRVYGFVDYSMHLDVNSVYDTGIDYTNSITNDKNSRERTIRDGSKIVSTENISKEPDNIDFSVNLESLGYPDQYNLIFTTLSSFDKNGTNCSLQDITNFIPLPPPTFDIVTSSNPELRPGEEQIIEVKVKSNSNVNALVSLLPFHSNSISTDFSPDKITLVPSQSAISRLNVKVAGNATQGSYTIPIGANISFPSQVKAKLYGIILDMANPIGANISKVLDLTVKILKPMEPYEHLQNFVDHYFTPLTGIYQTMASIIGGISGYLIGTFKEKQKEKKNKAKSRA